MASSFFDLSQFARLTGSIMELIRIRKDESMVLLGLVMIVVGVYLVCNGDK